MLIENGYHYRTLDVVVRLSALYKKSWILIRLRHSNILYITLYHMCLTKVLHNACGKPVETLWKTCGDMGVTYITPICIITISL